MSGTPDAPKGKMKRTSVPPPTQNTSHNDPERNAVRDEIDAILRSIPFLGGILVIIRLKWGWVGVLSLVLGFVAAVGLIYLGWLPGKLVSNTYKTPTDQPPSEPPSGYELLANDKVSWDTLVNNAHDIHAYGVAWTRLDPRLIVKNVAEGRLTARIVLLDPCSPVTEQRETDEGPAGGTRQSILGQLNKFRRHQNALEPGQKKQLERSLQISLRGTYPTMNVVTADSDLYAYFCAFGEQCRHSPVLKFKNYATSPYAQYFARHLEAVLKAELQPRGKNEDKDEFENLKTDSKNEYRCP